MKEKPLNNTDERQLRKDRNAGGDNFDQKDNRKSESISQHVVNYGSISRRVIQNEVSRLQQVQSKRKSDVPSEIWLG